MSSWSSSLRRSLFVVAASTMLASSGALAQTKTDAAAVAAHRAKLQHLDQKLERVEKRMSELADRVGRGKLIKSSDEADAKELRREVEDYAKDMRAAFDAAIGDAKLAADTKGAQGSAAHLKVFEDIAKAHERRMKQLETKGRTVESQVRGGIVRLDKSVLDKLTPAERKQYIQSLSSEGKGRIRKLHPELFKQSLYDMLNMPRLAAACPGSACQSRADHFSAVRAIGSLLISPAEASVAYKCVGTCLARSWTSCRNCCISAGSSAITYWNRFVSCWNGCSWWQFWCPPACLITFVYRIA